VENKQEHKQNFASEGLEKWKKTCDVILMMNFRQCNRDDVIKRMSYV